MEKKWDFKIPEKAPSVLNKARLSIQRANNNLKYGFDGSYTPYQAGPQKAFAKPLLDIEVTLTTMLHSKELVGLLVESVKSGFRLPARARKMKRLQEVS